MKPAGQGGCPDESVTPERQVTPPFPGNGRAAASFLPPAPAAQPAPTPTVVRYTSAPERGRAGGKQPRQGGSTATERSSLLTALALEAGAAEQHIAAEKVELRRQYAEDRIGSFGLVMSVLKVIVGKGMLAHAYAYKLVGFEMFYLDCFVFLISYFQVLVLFASLRDGELSIWDTIDRSFGPRGSSYWQCVLFLGRSSTLVMILSIMGGCVQEVLHLPVQVDSIESGRLEEVFHPLRVTILLACAACCLVPTLSRMYATLQYFSALGVTACLSIFVVFLHVFVHNPHARAGGREGATPSVWNIPLVVGMSMYVSGGGDPSIADVLLRYTGGSPESHSVLDIAGKVALSFVTGFLVVVGLAAGCYQMYGAATMSNVVHNLAADPQQQGLLEPALVLLFLNGLCSYGLLGNVVFLKVEEETGWTPWAFRSLMLLLYFVLAVLVPNVSSLITLSGCFIQGQYKFLLPPLLFLTGHYGGDGVAPRRRACEPLLVVGSSFLLLVGLVMFGVGSLRIFLV